MAAPAQTTGLTYDDLASFPDDHRRRELIGGELIVTPSPRPRHQGVVAYVTTELMLYVRAHGGKVYPAPLDVCFAHDDVVEPDVLLLTAAHTARVEERFVRGAPDIVVEVSSPSTRRLELGRKLELYERYGVPEYWYVDLDADRVEVYRLVGEECYDAPELLLRAGVLTSPLLPGLALPVDDLLGPPEEETA
jgi:Uma2 family endonuclease